MLSKNACINNHVRICTLLDELSELQWDVVCISETHAVSDDSILDGGHRLITSRNDYVFSSVAILLHR